MAPVIASPITGSGKPSTSYTAGLCPASSSWQVLRLGKVGGARVGQADVDVVRTVPGQGLVRADAVVVDAVALRGQGEVEDVVDLFEEQPLVLQRPEPALPGPVLPGRPDAGADVAQFGDGWR